jgi:methionyl-tRNA formyltransferase
LVKGERKTGVTLFWIDEGMDTGPIQSVAQTDLPGDEDALSLFGRLSDIGAKLLSKTLADLAEDRVLREEQSGEPSKAPKIKPDFGRISFDMSAEELHNRVRGLRAGPGTFLLLENPKTEKSLRVKVLKTEFEEAESAAAPSDRTLPGAIVRVDPKKGILVQLSPGRLWFREVQPEGKKQQTSADFLNGLRLGAGDRLVAVP